MNTPATKIQVIEPSKGWQLIDWRELIRYQDLLYYMVVRGIKARYAQSILGISWAIIQPLFTTLIFTIVFGNVAQISSDGAPYLIFSFAAMLPWSYFSNTLTEAANSLVSNSNMITKVYFPRLILPISAAFAKLLDFAIAFLLLIALLFYFGLTPSWEVVFLPILMIIMIMFSLGLGMILSAMAVQYRDVKHAIGFLVQILLYAAPVVYASSSIPVKYQFWYSLNPMVGVIEGFRSMFLSTQPMPWDWILTGGVISVIIFVFGAFYFKRMEKIFADVA
jgi:lipopolysaccharide transport system permease protein